MPERVYQQLPVTIPALTALSAAVELVGFINGSLIMATAFTVAAAITFQGSNESATGTFYDVYDSAGNEVTIPSHATHTGRSYELPAAVMNFHWIKVRAGTTASPEATHAGAYALTLALKS